MVLNNDQVILYETSQKALSYSKKQQWVMANYGLLLFGAIIGFYRLMGGKDIGSCLMVFLVVVSSLICVTLFILIWNFQNDMHKNRMTIYKIKKSKQASKEFKKLLKLPSEPPSFLNGVYHPVIFSIVLIIGLVFVILALHV